LPTLDLVVIQFSNACGGIPRVRISRGQHLMVGEVHVDSGSIRARTATPDRAMLRNMLRRRCHAVLCN
jgi:hypothetical protein